MNKKIMILGASILQLPAIQQAKKMGLDVVAVDMNPNAIGFKESGVIKEVISTVDIPAVVDCANKYKIDGVITVASDMPIRTVAAVSKKLNIIGISLDTAIKATNKVEMRKCLREHNVPVPRFYTVNNLDKYLEIINLFPNKFIVKPADNSGSRGIYLVENKGNIKDVKSAFSYSQMFSRDGDVLIEEYMEGPEVSVETLTIDGECNIIQITDKVTTGSPHFVEIGHSQPSRLSSDVIKQICGITKLANKAIGIDNGPSHTEIIVTEEGPKIVELGARLGGDCITSHLVPLSTGINMVECCIKIALGEKPNIERKFNKASAIRYFNQKPGVIKSIEGISEALEIDGIQNVSIIHGVGSTITNIENSIARMGFVIAQSENVENACKICENALNVLNIKMMEEIR